MRSSAPRTRRASLIGMLAAVDISTIPRTRSWAMWG